MFTFLLLLNFSAKNKHDLIGLLDILCFPIPSNSSSSFKEAMNNEASFASSFVQVTMLACQAKASDRSSSDKMENVGRF